MKLNVLRVLAVGVVVGGIALAMNTEKVEAAEWSPRSVEAIKADIAKAKNNQYTIVWGDTMWGISQATNLTVQKLADLNKIANVDLIYAGNTLVFDGNVVTAKNDKGETVAQSVVTPQDKNDANKPVGKQAEEKAQGTPASSQSQNKQGITTTSGKTATSSQGTSAAASGTNGSQTGTSGSVEGTTSSTSGTTASSGVETPAQPSEPATPSQPTQPSKPAEKPATPTQPSTGGEQGGTTKPSETPKPAEPTIVTGYIGNSAGLIDQNGHVVSGLWDTALEANTFANWYGANNFNVVRYETPQVHYSDGTMKFSINFTYE